MLFQSGTVISKWNTTIPFQILEPDERGPCKNGLSIDALKIAKIIPSLYIVQSNKISLETVIE